MGEGFMVVESREGVKLMRGEEIVAVLICVEQEKVSISSDPADVRCAIG
jgi:hypothetical protein